MSGRPWIDWLFWKRGWFRVMSETCGECFYCHAPAVYACVECGVALCPDCEEQDLCPDCYNKMFQKEWEAQR